MATIAGTIWLYIIIPKGFFPTEDTGYHARRSPRRSTDISFDAMVERQRKVADIIRTDPAVDYVNSTVGAGGPNSLLNSGRMLVALKPQDERGKLRRSCWRACGSDGQRRPRHGDLLPADPEHQSRRQARQEPVPVHAAIERHRDALPAWRRELRDKIAKLPGLRDVTTDLYIKNPQMTIEVDREKAAVYGVTVDQVRQELFNAFGTRQVATIYTPTNDYQVILETKPEFQASPNDLESRHRISKTHRTARVVPLSAVDAFRAASVGPLQVNHQGQQPAVTISFNLAPGFSLGQAVDAIQQARARRPPAGHDHHRLPGHRAGVPGFACTGRAS